MIVVEYNHRIRQKPVSVKVPKRIARKIAALRVLVTK